MNEPTEEKSNHAGIIALGILCSVLFYFLSLGPAIWVAQRNPSVTPAFEIVYTPLDKLSRKIPAIRFPLDDYARMWQRP